VVPSSVSAHDSSFFQRSSRSRVPRASVGPGRGGTAFPHHWRSTADGDALLLQNGSGARDVMRDVARVAAVDDDAGPGHGCVERAVGSAFLLLIAIDARLAARPVRVRADAEAGTHSDSEVGGPSRRSSSGASSRPGRCVGSQLDRCDDRLRRSMESPKCQASSAGSGCADGTSSPLRRYTNQ
jgi:hypothetical protein